MASKSKRRRRVLGASCILAALIVGASSFAWFTSQDEVVNKLTASADYGVTIAEDFTPPENWIPGQEIDKNVGVVNTGNVDAFVRTWLEGEMRVVSKAASDVTAAGMSTATLTAVTDQQLTALNLNYSADTGKYLRELTSDTIQNPTTQTQNAASPEAYSEIMAVQAGGELALVTPETGNASYKFTPNQAINVVDEDGKQYQLAAGTEYTVTVNSGATKDIAVSGTAITLKDVSDFRTIDSNTFTPLTDGLYIFRRNTALSAPGSDDYEFSGYYVKTISGTQHFFALEYDKTSQRSDYVLPDSVLTVTKTNEEYTVANNGVKMFVANQNTLDNDALVWTYDSTNGVMKAKNGASGGILINVKLDNIGTAAEEWTAIGSGATTTFYYNNDLEEGATTSQFVDSVTMDDSVDQDDYLAFDFDLNVKMESIQVTIDANGNEDFGTVNSWAATGTSNTAATGGTGTVTNGEIELISWS